MPTKPTTSKAARPARPQQPKAAPSQPKSQDSKRPPQRPKNYDPIASAKIKILARNGGTGLTTNQKEIIFEATDFLDYAPVVNESVLVYDFKYTQDYIGKPGATAGQTLSRPLSVTVYALPRAVNANVATSTFISQYGTQVNHAGGNSLSSVSNTLVAPTFNIKWKKIGHTNFEKLYRDTVVQPSEKNNGLELFRLKLVDPDSAAPVTGPIQLAVKIRFAQVVPVVNTINVDIGAAQDFGAGATMGTAETTYSMVTIRGMRNFT